MLWMFNPCQVFSDSAGCVFTVLMVVDEVVPPQWGAHGHRSSPLERRLSPLLWDGVGVPRASFLLSAVSPCPATLRPWVLVYRSPTFTPGSSGFSPFLALTARGRLGLGIPASATGQPRCGFKRHLCVDDARRYSFHFLWAVQVP